MQCTPYPTICRARLGAFARHSVTFAPICMVILMARGSQAFDEINKQKTEKNTNGGKPKFT